jgi:hypothetical protein
MEQSSELSAWWNDGSANCGAGLVKNRLMQKKKPLKSEQQISDLTQELNALSVQERDNILYDIHGVKYDTTDANAPNDELDETPARLARALAELDALWRSQVQKEANTSLRLAVLQYQDRVSSTKFRLMFLRADDFDVPKTMQRIINHFDQQRYLFGEPKVGKKITLEDLKEYQDTWSVIESGPHQLLPSKDRSGRCVIFLSVAHAGFDKFSQESIVSSFIQQECHIIRPKRLLAARCSLLAARCSLLTAHCSLLTAHCSLLTARCSLLTAHCHSKIPHQLRERYYTDMTAVEDDEDVQRQGIVGIASYFGVTRMDFQPSRFKKTIALNGGLPSKFRSLHFCMSPENSDALRFILQFRNIFKKNSRHRTRIHEGTWMECKYKLMTFGIPTNYLPYDANGEKLLLEQHTKWLQRRQEIDAQEKTLFSKVTASPVDELAHLAQVVASPIRTTQQNYVDTIRLGVRSLMMSLTAPVNPSAGGGMKSFPDFQFGGNELLPNQHQQGYPLQRHDEMEALDARVVPSFAHFAIPDVGGHLRLDRSTIGSSSSCSSSMIPQISNHEISALSVALPTPNDVLFGRGKSIQDHPGNIAFVSLIESLYPQYDILETKQDKTEFSERVVQRFKALGGRFLKPHWKNPSFWQATDNAAARIKVSHAFRSRRRDVVAKKKKAA